MNSMDNWYEDYGWEKVAERAIAEHEQGSISALCKHGRAIQIKEDLEVPNNPVDSPCCPEEFILVLDLWEALEIPQRYRVAEYCTDDDKRID